MLPIVGIPLVVKEYCSRFAAIFKRSEQRKNFEAFVTGLTISDNRTIAGINQRLVFGPTYDSLHHFMWASPWSVEALKEQRLKYVKEQMQHLCSQQNVPFALIETTAKKPSQQAVQYMQEKAEKTTMLPEVMPSKNSGSMKKDDSEPVLQWKKAPSNLPVVVTLDATFIHHTGKDIYGVYWYWDYAQRRYTWAQRMLLSTLVTPEKQIPLGWRLYHRGFMEEQKAYLEEAGPEPDADESAWAEYDKLIEKFEQNEREHKTQHELATELVDESERLGMQIDGYVCDGAMAVPELMDKIEQYDRAWVSKLAKNRLVQTAEGDFKTIACFAKSLPEKAFKPINVQTRHGEKRTYWVFSKCLMVHKWKKLRIVISYDNAKLEGEPIYLITNKKQWVQPEKVVQLYMMRDSIEHLIRDGKQELGLEDCQQRNEDGVRKHWELSFTAHTFLELGFKIPNLPGVPAVRLETIGQKSRVMEGTVLHGLVTLVKQLVLEGRNTEEIVCQTMKKRLNRLAT